MARPIGKYFAPVIKLLLEAKKSEQIIVDENFKQKLRMEMMARIGALPVDKKSGAKKLTQHASELGHGLNHSWWTAWEGLMIKYKYVFAGVPVALVVFVVALQIARMPVNIPSKVVAPVMEVKTEQDMGQANLIAADAVNLASGAFAGDVAIGNGGQSAGDNQSNLKTFPGYLVMPAAYRAKYGLGDATANFVQESGAQAAEQASSSKMADTSVPALLMAEPGGSTVGGTGAEGNAQFEQPKARNIEQTAAPITAPAVQMAAPSTFVRVVQPAVNATSGVNQILNNDATVVPTPTIQTPMMLNTVNPAVTTAPIITTNVPVTITTPTITSQAIIPAPAVTAPATIAPSVNLVPAIGTLSAPVIPTIAPAVQMPVRNRVYIIEYSVQLTDLQKSVLESKTVLPLITGKNVTIFKVSAERSGGVLLEIYFDDGSKYSASYTWDEAGKSWVKVVAALDTLAVSALHTTISEPMLQYAIRKP